ncbi:hypothetical protein HZY91_02430 [Facklamia sp. DSM 111018]|uniref:Metal ABC transporter substrate-binding protein n=1 Tax=Facklamia lactis TaxID=2749967 RepID=A0ABS0LNL2_9LACT|nr:MetQ/NlpA family ABC transporter substrate-binding protein [Facklamia lactis]MBG9985746.1 hypothetical protein [Facklamia lactis]
MKNMCKNLLLLIMAVTMFAMSTDVAFAKETIKIGTVGTSSPLVEHFKEVMEEKGEYKVEVISFDGNHLPAVALSEGEIDGVIANHKVWLETFNQENNAKLEMVEPFIAYGPQALYSEKHEKIEDIPEEAVIAIAGDPANMERSLILLEDIGLVTLGEKKGEFYNLGDIQENTKKIEILETEITATVRNIKDVDVIITPPMMLQQNDMDFENYLAVEPSESAQNFAIGLIVNTEDEENSEWLDAGKEVVGSKEYMDKVKETYGGAYFYDFNE